MKIIDLHCDSIMQLMNNENQTIYDKGGHLDLIKMQKGDYLLQCFAMFVNLRKVDSPYEYCKKMIKKYYENINQYPQLIRPVYNYRDIINNINDGLISAMLTIEEGGTLEGDIQKLKEFYDLGVRMITLTWNYPNELGNPNINNDLIRSDTEYQEVRSMIDQKGLTKKGVEVIQEMERMGIIIDVSHLGDQGVRDVLKNTTKPFVASHSNARAICDFPRNLPDELLVEMKKRNCLVGVNYCPSFVKAQASSMQIVDLIKHIDYLKELIGIDCIALGSDFDGIGGDLELKDASYLPLLINKLSEHGYSDADINKITHQNALRLFKEVLNG